jgi:hypothetical protein
MPSTQIASIISLIWQHISTSKCHGQPSSTKYLKTILNIIKDFSPTGAQLDSLKNNINFALKLTLKSFYMFWCKTPSSGSIPSEPC